MFDVDPKWAELVKERGNLPHDLQKRLPGNDRGGVNKGKSPGRPPMMPSPTSAQQSNSANLAATSMASGLNFPSLGNLNNSLLSGLSLGNFDPKNNPLLMPFGGLPNLGALSGLGNLGNLSNMSLTNSLFANLAGLGLPSLAGMEAALSATAAAASTSGTTVDTNNSSVSSSGGGGAGGKSGGASSSGMNNSGSSKSRSSKLDQPSTSGKSSVPSTSSGSSSGLPTTTPFPFFFPNPGLLYTPLGLGGLNPFSMQPGSVSSAYESLAQCGLLNPPTSSTATSAVRKPTSSTSSSRQRETVPDAPSSSSSSSSKRKEPEKKSSRYSVDPAVTLQQYTDLAALHSEDRRRVDQQSQQQQHEKRETAITEQADIMIADLSEKKIERKSKEQEMKEALEHLSRTSAELVTRNIDDTASRVSEKRSRSNIDTNQSSEQPQQQSTSLPLEVTLEPVTKKSRIEATDINVKSTLNKDTPTIEIEPVTRSLPTTPVKAVSQASQEESGNVTSPSETPVNANKKETNETAAAATTTTTTTTTATTSSTSSSLSSLSSSTPAVVNTTSPPAQCSTGTAAKTADVNKTAAATTSEVEEDSKGGTKGKKARSGKRLSVEPPPERKNLRSSAGRQARAAAERQARMEGEMHSSEQQQQQEGHTAGE